MARAWAFIKVWLCAHDDPMGDHMPDGIARVAKAVGSGIAAGATFLLGVWSESAGFTEAFSTMTGVQWLGLTLSVLGVYGITYRLPNRSV